MRAAALILILLLLAGCAQQEARTIKSVQNPDELRQKADPVALENNNIILKAGKSTELGVAVKNIHDEKTMFTVRPSCNDARGNEINLIETRKGAISPGKTAVITLEINSKNVEKMPYICSVQVSSELGMRASNELIVNIN
jgi:hypothetical protein